MTAKYRPRQTEAVRFVARADQGRSFGASPADSRPGEEEFEGRLLLDGGAAPGEAGSVWVVSETVLVEDPHQVPFASLVGAEGGEVGGELVLGAQPAVAVAGQEQ